jgi:hypothetical protein
MSTQQLKGKGSSKANNNNNKIESKNSKKERHSSEKKRFNNYASKTLPLYNIREQPLLKSRTKIIDKTEN